MPMDALGPNMLPDLGVNPVSSPPRNAVRTTEFTSLEYRGSVAEVTMSGTSTWMNKWVPDGETCDLPNDNVTFNPIWSAVTVEGPFPEKLPMALVVVVVMQFCVPAHA